MIDRERPEDSLLVQYSLPPETAKIPHPQVANYKGTVPNKTNGRYRELVHWMGQVLSPVAPDYGIDMGDSATSKPAGRSGNRGADGAADGGADRGAPDPADRGASDARDPRRDGRRTTGGRPAGAGRGDPDAER